MTITVRVGHRDGGAKLGGSSARAWRKARFKLPPVLGSPYPDADLPDAGPVTTGTDGMAPLTFDDAGGDFWVSFDAAGRKRAWETLVVRPQAAAPVPSGNCMPDGTLAAPGWSFCDDTAVGFYRVKPDTLGVASLVARSGPSTVPYQVAGFGGFNVTGGNPLAPCAGTISHTAASTTITGSGTAFLSEVQPGDTIVVTTGGSTGASYHVNAVSSDTSLTLAPEYSTALTFSGESFEIGVRPNWALFDDPVIQTRPVLYSDNGGVYVETRSSSTGLILDMGNDRSSGQHRGVRLNVYDSGGPLAAIWQTTPGDGSNTPVHTIFDGQGDVMLDFNLRTTSTTTGFTWLPSCAGTPTGTPDLYTSYSYTQIPIIFDATNKKMYAYFGGGGGWKSVTFA